MLGILRLGKDIIIAPACALPPAVFEVHCARCWTDVYISRVEWALAYLECWPILCEPCADVVEREQGAR